MYSEGNNVIIAIEENLELYEEKEFYNDIYGDF